MTPQKNETPCLNHEGRISENARDIKTLYKNNDEIKEILKWNRRFVIATFVTVLVRYLPAIFNFINKNVEAINK